MWMSSYESDLGVKYKMDYKIKIALANKRIENEMFIDYLKGNIKELNDALNKIDEIAKERHKLMTEEIWMVSLFSKLNVDLYNHGWTQEEIDLVLFGTTDDLKYTQFEGR